MDTYELPLNLAHQQDRKAEQYLNGCKFEDAILCHQRAAEYLSKALQMTSTPSAQQSLVLQREHHIKQQAIIQDKWQRFKLAEKTLAKKESVASVTVNDDVDSAVHNGHTLSVHGGALGTSDHHKNLIYQTIEECDSLLAFLNDRAAEKGQEIKQPASLSSRDDKTNVVHSAVKVPKSDQDILEELRVHNEALRSHVLHMLQETEQQQRELDFYKKENRQLSHKIMQLEKQTHDSTEESEEKFKSLPLEMNLDELPSLELPPLEMPTFDLDSLKDRLQLSSTHLDNLEQEHSG